MFFMFLRHHVGVVELLLYFPARILREEDSQVNGVKVFGLYGNLWDADDPRAPFEARFTKGWVRGVPGTIAGGSSEVQRNVIATRGLGLPRG